MSSDDDGAAMVNALKAELNTPFLHLHVSVLAIDTDLMMFSGACVDA